MRAIPPTQWNDGRDPPRAAEVRRLLVSAGQTLQRDERGSRLYVDRAAQLVAGRLERSPRRRGGLSPLQLLLLRAYIECNLHTPILVAELARIVDLSTSYFRSAFRARFGIAPHAFIVRARVLRAKHLMRCTTAPLKQICVDCGFADAPHMTRAFRRREGITPAAWRRKSKAHQAQEVELHAAC